LRIAVATCRVKPEPDPDETPLLAALTARGVHAETLAWDDPAAAPADEFDLVVIRSTWNYFLDPARFVDWAQRTASATLLRNAEAAVRWNLHKRYLLELERAGLPVVATALVPQGPEPDLAALCAARGWPEIVVKPAVSASSFRTRRFAAEEHAAQAFLRSLCAHRDALVQPALPGFTDPGERAHVWIAGEHTHCVNKQPRFAGEDERVSGAQAPSAEERALMRRVLAALPHDVRRDLLYARLDLVSDPDGRLLVSELELLEPSLFLIQHPPALERLAAAVAAAAK
jgi:hypothetical protein